MLKIDERLQESFIVDAGGIYFYCLRAKFCFMGIFVRGRGGKIVYLRDTLPKLEIVDQPIPECLMRRIENV